MSDTAAPSINTPRSPDVSASSIPTTQAHPKRPAPPTGAGTVSGPAGNNLIWKICKGACRTACTLCLDLKVYGATNVPETGGALIVGNHQSYIDPIANAVLVRRPMSYLAKAELFEHRFTNFLFRALHGIPVRQGEGDVGALRETIARLKEGHALMMFPEGSRCEDGELAPLEPGVGLIARKAGVPIIPVAIEGAFKALPRGAKMVKCGPVRVQFGPAIDITGLKAGQIVSQIESTLRQMIEQLRLQMRDEARKPIRL